MKRMFLIFTVLMLTLATACGGVGPADDNSSQNGSPQSESAILLNGDGHPHTVADTPQTVSDPYVGFCGNTQTTVYFNGKSSGAFMYGDSVYLTELLLNLDYDPKKLCKCRPEYTVDTEFYQGYGINLTDGYARCDKGQAELTESQVEKVRQIVYNIFGD